MSMTNGTRQPDEVQEAFVHQWDGLKPCCLQMVNARYHIETDLQGMHDRSKYKEFRSVESVRNFV